MYAFVGKGLVNCIDYLIPNTWNGFVFFSPYLS